MAAATLASGIRICSMGQGKKDGLTVHGIEVATKQVKSTVLVLSNGMIVLNSLGNSFKMRFKGKASTSGPTVAPMKANGSTT